MNINNGFSITDAQDPDVQDYSKKKTLANKQYFTDIEHSMILASLNQLYAFTFLVDLEEDTYKNVTNINHVRTTNHSVSYSSAIQYLLQSFIHEDDIITFRNYTSAENIRSRLEHTHHIEFEFRKKSLTEHDEWYQLFIIPIPFEPEFGKVIIAGRSITEQKEAELERQLALKNACNAAQRATRAKSRFLKSMSHDIRTPMNAILGYCNLVSAHITDSPKLSEYLDKISSAGNHLLKLINDILDMARLEEGNSFIQPETFDLSAELKNIVNLIQPEMDEHNHTFITDISDLEHDLISTDLIKFRKILLNVLSNAAKYTQDGGLVIFIVNRKPSNIPNIFDYEFIIRDNGFGISKEFIEHIYEPFAREGDAIKQSIEGTGLGLAIVHNLVKLMNGNIYVDSTPGEGTKFTIYLPLTRVVENASAICEPDKPQPDINTLISSHDYSGKRILLAEDNPHNADLIKEFLSGTGILLEFAANGSEAINMFQNKPYNYYNTILMDIQMPLVDGYTATRTIRNNISKGGDTIPIIAMTANAFSDDVRAAKEAGMNEHIAKPINIPVLYSVLDKHLF